jgi:23S rRNA (cytosine1962-C5)-methyltransferase
VVNPLNTGENFDRQAEMLANRVKKRFKHLHKKFERQHIEVFRLYDWDIPEIRAVVDWYAGHLVIGEYKRKQSTAGWLPAVAAAAARTLQVPAQNVHLKQRIYGKSNGKRYARINYTNRLIRVCERDLAFFVNPWDYVDTGLFSDHRNTRQMIRALCPGKDFLNLFCYTGTFSCYAAKGGARSTVSVDRSKTAITWARQNMAINQLSVRENRLIQAHVFDFLKRARQRDMRFDLAVVDPPSFYTVRNKQESFDIGADHPELLSAVLSLMRQGGYVFFSTNHQAFKPRLEGLNASDIIEITSQTIPEDYQNKRKKIHRCWKIKV